MSDTLGPIIPPLRFAAVAPHVYRGSYPRPVNYRFLKRYRIKTIISLIPNEISEENDPHLVDFALQQGIRLIHMEVGKGGKGKKRQVPLTQEVVNKVLSLIESESNRPVYFHCLNGGHVTLLVVACLRSRSNWSKASIFSEFIQYSETVTVADRAFVEEYDRQTKKQAEALG